MPSHRLPRSIGVAMGAVLLLAAEAEPASVDRPGSLALAETILSGRLNAGGKPELARRIDRHARRILPGAVPDCRGRHPHRLIR